MSVLCPRNSKLVLLFLNFDDFSFDDISQQANPGAKTKDRTPVNDVFDGTISGIRDELKSPSFIAKAMKEVLPEQYGEIFSAVDDTRSTISSLYDEASREVKPQLAKMV